MTPFEAAGYTKATKFIAQRDTVGFTKGEILWLHRDDNTICPEFTNGDIDGYMYLPLAETSTEFLDLKVYVEEPVLSLDNYPNPRHKHADVIHAWAEGAEIEYKSGMLNSVWEIIQSPAFTGSGQYRVKPSKSQKQIEKEALQEQLAKIEQETATLKQQLSQLGE